MMAFVHRSTSQLFYTHVGSFIGKLQVIPALITKSIPPPPPRGKDGNVLNCFLVYFWRLSILLSSIQKNLSPIWSVKTSFCQFCQKRYWSLYDWSLERKRSVNWVGSISPTMGWGIDSRKRVWNWVAKLRRLAGQYDNPMPTWFLAPIAGLKLPALVLKLDFTAHGLKGQ